MTAANATPLAVDLMATTHYTTTRAMGHGVLDRLLREHRDALIEAGALDPKNSFAAGHILVHAARLDAFITKLEATWGAKFALKGYTLQRLADRSFIVSRWSLVKPLPDLLAVAEFARQAGAA